MKTKLLVMMIMLAFVIGCQDEEFPPGTEVRIKLDGRKGIVLSPYGSGYFVRVVARQDTTKTKLLSSDDPIDVSPYSKVLFNEFEIEKWTPAPSSL